MKKIINGKLYDTEKAESFGSRTQTATLYRRDDLSYFIHFTDTNMADDQIQIVTEDEAKEWAVKNLSAEEYLADFGEPEE